MDGHDVLQFAAEEADQRPLRFRSVEILDYEPTRGAGEDGRELCPPGSVTLFFTRRGDESGFISRVRRAATDANENHADFVRELHAQYHGRDRVSYGRAWRLLRRQPFFADVRCGARLLATNVFLPEDLSVGVISFPHNGGRLPADTLTLVEHVREDIDASEPGAEFEAIALRNPGPLTRLELEALEQVPEDQWELNIAPPADCCADVTLVVIVVLMMIALRTERAIDSLPAARIERLSPGATARELMELRREALGHSH